MGVNVWAVLGIWAGLSVPVSLLIGPALRQRSATMPAPALAPVRRVASDARIA